MTNEFPEAKERPWRASDLFVVSNTGTEPTVARTTGLTREEARANAQLIVTAVNSYDALREAAQAALTWIEQAAAGGAAVNRKMADSPLARQLRAALYPQQEQEKQ